MHSETDISGAARDFGRGAALISPSVDWITASQRFPGLPDFVGDKVIVLDSRSGELRKEFARKVEMEGSYSTRCVIRCLSERLSIDFNPSRFNQRHSLDGVTDGAAALEVCNRAIDAANDLYKVDLPHFFESNRPENPVVRGVIGSEAVAAPDGVRISRLDGCESFCVGDSESARLYLDAAACVSARGREAERYGSSVYWHKGSRRKLVKLYEKSAELLAHYRASVSAAKKLARERGEVFSEDAESREYMERLAAFCAANGVIRHEFSFKSLELSDRGLTRFSDWSQDKLRAVLREHSYDLDMSVSENPLLNIEARLVALGVSRGRARAAEAAAALYAQGKPLSDRWSRATFYRVKSDLKKVGLDISVRSNIAMFSPRIRVIERKPLMLPREFLRSA